MSPLDVTDCPYYLISRATLAMTSALKASLAAAGLDHIRPAYLGILMSLWQEDGLRAVELSRRAGLEPSTITGLLDRMERDGLAERRADPEDRRALRIHLTERGRQARDAVEAVVLHTMADNTRDISDDELERLKATLRKVLANAHAPQKGAKDV